MVDWALFPLIAKNSLDVATLTAFTSQLEAAASRLTERKVLTLVTLRDRLGDDPLAAIRGCTLSWRSQASELACVTKLGKACGAKSVLYGRAERSEKGLKIQAVTVNTDTGKTGGITAFEISSRADVEPALIAHFSEIFGVAFPTQPSPEVAVSSNAGTPASAAPATEVTHQSAEAASGPSLAQSTPPSADTAPASVLAPPTATAPTEFLWTNWPVIVRSPEAKYTKYALTGAGVLCLMAGAAFGAHASSLGNDINATTPLPRVVDLVGRANIAADRANGLFIAGAAGLVLSGALWVADLVLFVRHRSDSADAETHIPEAAVTP